MTNRTRGLSVASAATAMLTLALPAAPAAAGPDASGRLNVNVIDIDEDLPPEADFCGITGLTVEVHEQVRIREFFTYRGRDSIPHYTSTFHATITFTGSDGTTVTLRANEVGKDQRVVDNGDGTRTVMAFGAGGFTLAGPSTTLRNPGRSVFQLVVDTNGTPLDPSDDDVVEGSFEVVRESTGLNETSDDFCADYRAVTGRTG